MMSELSKLKLEELTFDIAVAKCITIVLYISYCPIHLSVGDKPSSVFTLLNYLGFT